MPQYRTAAQWSAANPVLLRGELGVESDTRKFKFGDGSTAWNSLGYAQSDSSEVIMISDAESIGRVVTHNTWSKIGQIRPLVVVDPTGVSGLPSDIPSDCNLVGTAQFVDDMYVTDENGYLLTLNVVQKNNILSGIWYQIYLNAAGDVIAEKKFSLDDSEGDGETTAPVRINEYGAIYDNGTFINLPSGAIVSWYADNAGADGDMGPFKGEAIAVWGIYIAIDGSEKPSSRSGMLVAYRADGEKGMATCYIYGTKEQGGVMNADDWAVYTHGDSAQNSLPFDGPIPGYELIYSDTGAVLQLASGTEVTINFDKKLTLSQLFGSKARFMIEASIISVSGSTHTLAVPVPITIFQPAATGSRPVFEYMSQSLATGTNIARVKLIVTSWIRESRGVTGCNLMVQTNNLNPSMNYALTFPGMYVKSSGGDSSR